MAKIINSEQLLKEQKEKESQKNHEEMMRGLAGLAARSSGSLEMPNGYEKYQNNTDLEKAKNNQ